MVLGSCSIGHIYPFVGYLGTPRYMYMIPHQTHLRGVHDMINIVQPNLTPDRVTEHTTYSILYDAWVTREGGRSFESPKNVPKGKSHRNAGKTSKSTEDINVQSVRYRYFVQYCNA